MKNLLSIPLVIVMLAGVIDSNLSLLRDQIAERSAIILANSDEGNQNGQGGGSRTSRPTPKPVTADDFELKITAVESTVPQGEGVRVNVELKNNSGQDLEIVYEGSLYWPVIPGWDPFGCNCIGNCRCPSRYDSPLPQSIFIPINNVIQLGEFNIDSSTLLLGTHELRFTARFWIQGQGHLWDDQIDVWSNTVILTVQ